MAATTAQKRYWASPKGKAMKKAADARYYEKNAARLKDAAQARYDALTDDERRERVRKDKARPKATQERRDYFSRLKLDVVQGYGGHCACCGNDHLPHLTIDHVNGGGSQHRKVEHARSLHARLRREGFPPGYRVLCFNCNFGAHLNGGECGCGLTVTREGVI